MKAPFSRMLSQLPALLTVRSTSGTPVKGRFQQQVVGRYFRSFGPWFGTSRSEATQRTEDMCWTEGGLNTEAQQAKSSPSLHIVYNLN